MNAATALLLACACSTFAQVAAQKPSYEVRRAPAPIKIDGRVDAKEWAAADQAIEFIFPWASQTGAKQKTHARLLWDDQYLYVAYECEDTDLTAQVQGRDEFVYRDDTVELFLNVKPSQTRAYYCIETNARGTVMDYVCIDAQSYMRRFDMDGLKLGIRLDGTMNMRGDQDRGWNLELAVPWKNFADMTKPPSPGTIFTAELNRWDGVEPNRCLSVWVDPKLNWPHPHAPQEFGNLKFVK
jgi:hypothetical protein